MSESETHVGGYLCHGCKQAGSVVLVFVQVKFQLQSAGVLVECVKCSKDFRTSSFISLMMSWDWRRTSLFCFALLCFALFFSPA